MILDTLIDALFFKSDLKDESPGLVTDVIQQVNGYRSCFKFSASEIQFGIVALDMNWISILNHHIFSVFLWKGTFAVAIWQNYTKLKFFNFSMPENWNRVLVSHIDRYFLTDPFLFVMFFFGYSASWYCLLNLEAFFSIC